MKINPTSTRRIIVIDIQTRTTDQATPNLKAAVATEVITGIQMIADDGIQIREASLSDAAEIDLLRDFWEAVQPNDLFYGYRIDDLLALLRRRTWELDLVPSRDLDLRTVYGHDTVDTAILRSSTGTAGYRSAQALASVLDLRTRTSKPGERSLRERPQPSLL